MMLGALLLGAHSAAMGQADCAGPIDLQGPECRIWIHSDRLLYAARDGKLYRMHFNNTGSELLVDHAFTSLTFSLSPDARYIAYAGYSNGHAAAYVYDNVEGADHALPIAEDRSFKAEFSPDGSMLAWADVARPAPHPRIAIMTLADRSIRSIAFPVDVRSLADYRETQMRWSMDGHQLLVASVAYPKGAYFEVSLAGLAIAPIEGRFAPGTQSGNATDAGLHFSRDGHELAYYRPPCLQWRCPGQGRAAPGEGVHVDQHNRLIVTMPGGVEQVVARGGCESCGDDSVRVLSWLEEGRYLVYQLKGATYIYGVDGGRTARLFDPGWQFGWHDPENRAPAVP